MGTGKLDPLNPPADFSGIMVMANVTVIDTVRFDARVRYLIFPFGEYDSGRDDVEQFSKTVTLITNGKRSNITKFDLNPGEEATYIISTGDPNKYPFDEYTLDFFISAKEGTKDVPIMFGIVGNVMGWNIDPYVLDLPGGRIGVYMVATRGAITKFFSMFVIFNMWVLSMTVLTLSSTIWFRERKVEPNLIGLATGLLFALPAIRNTQSGAPIIGCTSDTSGFFWNMALVALSAFLLMLNYIVSYKREKPLAAK